MQGGIAIARLSPLIIPIFISHMGCPHRCMFCDQRQFSLPVPPGEIPGIVERFLSFSSHVRERTRLIAFYGGTFTGLDEDLMCEYLDVASSLRQSGVVHGMKVSTRPDMVTRKVLNMLSDAGCREVEIGVQSMDDAVLFASRRGHTRTQCIDAASLIHASGMQLGVQLMPGLPTEDRNSFISTIDAVVSLKPDTARVYPVVVIGDTGLETLYRQGRYTPLSLEEALLRALYASLVLQDSGCRILRVGLPQSDSLNVVAGPYHPAFGSMVRAQGFRILAEHLLADRMLPVRLSVNPRDLPDLLGYRRKTVEDLKFSYSFDETLPRGYMRIQDQGERACLQLRDIIEYIL
ncbi:MAG: elongator complex protein 3 [Desulfomonilia bacterium]